ncbi:hypothetical protein, partial [Streptomyces sp. NPDC058867]|uniref:hypothetical protein n=1 Tax=unclassified Streptomyces TaxID=2593676 RepID=UPI00369985D8
TTHWADAFAALDTAGLPVTLNGTHVRLADTPPDTVRAALTGTRITADVREVPATLEEKMTVIDRRPTPR